MVGSWYPTVSLSTRVVEGAARAPATSSVNAFGGRSKAAVVGDFRPVADLRRFESSTADGEFKPDCLMNAGRAGCVGGVVSWRAAAEDRRRVPLGQHAPLPAVRH